MPIIRAKNSVNTHTKRSIRKRTNERMIEDYFEFGKILIVSFILGLLLVLSIMILNSELEPTEYIDSDRVVVEKEGLYKELYPNGSLSEETHTYEEIKAQATATKKNI